MRIIKKKLKLMKSSLWYENNKRILYKWLNKNINGNYMYHIWIWLLYFFFHLCTFFCLIFKTNTIISINWRATKRSSTDQILIYQLYPITQVIQVTNKYTISQKIHWISFFIIIVVYYISLYLHNDNTMMITCWRPFSRNVNIIKIFSIKVIYNTI